MCVCVCVCVREGRKIELTAWGKKVPIALAGIRTCTSGLRAHRTSDYTTIAGTPHVWVETNTSDTQPPAPSWNTSMHYVTLHCRDWWYVHWVNTVENIDWSYLTFKRKLPEVALSAFQEETTDSWQVHSNEQRTHSWASATINHAVK